MKTHLVGRFPAMIASLKMDILKEASPILLGLFTIMFGLHSDYAITRTMETIVPAGVGHFTSEPFVVAGWRVVSMVICALCICIIFLHAAILVIKMQLRGSLIAIYAKVFFAFYLSMAPWMTLHIARLVAAVIVPGISVGVDIIFLGMYGVGAGVLWGVAELLERWTR